MSKTKEIPVFGSGKYLKKCSGCKREYRTDARNARFGPKELCGCLERRAKNRAKRRKEKRKYWKDPEKHRALSLTRARSRKKLLEYCSQNGIVPVCNQCGRFEGDIKKLHCHHRDSDPFNLYLELYPTRSNLEWVCRTCHERCDRAGEGHGQLVLWEPPHESTWVEFLVRLREVDPRSFFLVSVLDHLDAWRETRGKLPQSS